MLLIKDNIIKMTRGDTVTFGIQVRKSNGELYTLEENDKIVFYLSKHPDKSPLIIKTFTDNNIKLESNDTKFLKYGEYFWKCELISGNNINSICGGRCYLTGVSNK